MLRVLHIGSHFGNIGDNASHTVVRDAISRRVPAEFENLEIRRFYRNARELLRFDDDFVRYANTFDLVLFGGGNFLEPIHDYSSTATTLDISPETLSLLRVPFVINAVGFDPAEGEEEELLDRFRAWVRVVAEHPRMKMNLRGDGSPDDFERLIGSMDDLGIGLVPDPGLFYRPPREFPFTSRDYVAVNLAGDLEALRYPQPGEKDELFAALREFIAGLPDEMAFVLVPHVALDVTIMGEFLRDCTDWASRKRILVAPLLQGYDDFWKTWAIYRDASGIIANRFHSLICNIQYDIPMAVLAKHPQISGTLERMGLHQLAYTGEGESELLDRLVRGGDDSRRRRAALVAAERVDFEKSIDDILAFAGA